MTEASSGERTSLSAYYVSALFQHPSHSRASIVLQQTFQSSISREFFLCSLLCYVPFYRLRFFPRLFFTSKTSARVSARLWLWCETHKYMANILGSRCLNFSLPRQSSRPSRGRKMFRTRTSLLICRDSSETMPFSQYGTFHEHNLVFPAFADDLKLPSNFRNYASLTLGFLLI